MNQRLPQWLTGLLLVLPWLQPWAPGPEPNTFPLLISWATLALLMLSARVPTAHELARAWAWAAMLSSLMGLLQYFGEAGRLGGWVHVHATLGEASSNLRQRNQLATLTSIGAAAVLWWHAHGLRRVHAIWMLAILALGNAATGSRTGLLQWLLVLPGLQLMWQAANAQRRAAWSWSLLLWAALVYLAASFALPHLLTSTQGLSASSGLVRLGNADGCASRSVLWANVAHLIGQKPWTGWGWGELKYAHYMASYSGERFCEILGNAHNLPLHLAFALGLPTTVLLALLLLFLALRARPWRASQTGSSLGWAVLAVTGLHSLLEFPLWYGPFQLAVLWSVLLLWPAGARWLELRPRALQASAGISLLLICLIAWDYQRVRQIYLPAAQRSVLWREDPWAAANQTWFFGDAVRFAKVTSTPVTDDNAARLLQDSLSALHYSPEPRVVQKLVESAERSGQAQLAQWHRSQLRRVYGAAAAR